MQIIDVCYQRHPVDLNGVTAAIDLAINKSELENIQKMEFVKRKVEFMQEFGNIEKYREAAEQLREFKRLCADDIKAEARRRKELEEQEEHFKELEQLKAQVRFAQGCHPTLPLDKGEGRMAKWEERHFLCVVLLQQLTAFGPLGLVI